MNISRTFTFGIACLLLVASAYADIFEYLGLKGGKESTPIFAPGIAERREQLESLKKELDDYNSQLKEFNENLQAISGAVNRHIAEIKTELEQVDQKEHDFLNAKLSLLNETHQVLYNLQFAYKGIITLLEQYIKMLEEYLKDPDFKSLAPEPRAVYSYDYLQELARKVSDQEYRLDSLSTKKKEAETDLENFKAKLASVTKKYTEKKKEQKEFSAKGEVPEESGSAGLTFKQRGELLDLERKLLDHEKQLAEYKVQEALKRNAFLETGSFVEGEKLKLLRSYLALVKSKLRVDLEDVITQKERLEKLKQESLSRREKSLEAIKKLTADKERLQKQLEQKSKQFELPTAQSRSAFAWGVENKTVAAFHSVCEVGLPNVQMHLIEQKIDQLNAQISFEEKRVQQQEVAGKIIETWYKIKSRKLRDADDINQELKSYKELEGDIARDLSTFKDRRAAVTNLLNLQTKELTTLRGTITQFNESSELFADQSKLQTTCANRFSQAEKIIGEQQELSSKLIELYTRIITTLDETKKEIASLSAELERKSILQRSEYAITWQGVRNIVTDMRYFIADVRTLGSVYMANLPRTIATAFKDAIQRPTSFVLLLMQLLLIIVGYFLLRRWLPLFVRWCMSIGPRHRVFYYLSRVFAVMGEFIHRYLIFVYIWVVLFIIVWFDLFDPYVYLKVLFFLFSIPFLAYLASLFVRFVSQFNENHNYPFFKASFTRRFMIILSTLLYAYAVIIPFREAFNLATIHKSELPIILSAILSIIWPILIILSIGREEILSIIPSRGSFWNWLSGIIERFYYLLIIFLIITVVLSNPYIGGYRNLVQYVLWGSLGTAIVVWLLYTLHLYTKKFSFNLFFKTDEDVVRERFMYARTLFGFWVIVLFLLFVVVAVALGAYIWNIPVDYTNVQELLGYKIFPSGALDRAGLPVYVTPLKILQILGFVLSGILCSYLVSRFVIKRVFEILPVDVGVQNTIESIARYSIIIAAVVIGFKWAGLDTLLLVIGVAIVSIAYIYKEPVGDLISYFIILVQRPIQIGDYILIDDENQGVVRHVTPRSVVVRRKDSYTIIIPNSMIVNRPVKNWSYARTFIAFDDIYFAVPYTADPEEVREIVARHLDENFNVLKSPKPIIRLDNFSPDGYVFLVRGFLSHTKVLYRFDITSDVRFGIIKTLRKHGIALALPTRLIVSQVSGQQVSSFPPSSTTQSATKKE